MSSSNGDKILFESSARYEKSNVLLELTSDHLFMKKKKFFSKELKTIEEYLLKDIKKDGDCISISQDKELLIIHFEKSNLELLFNSIDAARQLKNAIIDILFSKYKKSKKKDK